MWKMLTLLCAFWVVTAVSNAATLTVDLNGGAGYTDIQSAIDAGTSVGAPTTDIEGRGRPCGAGVDIGAYESGDCPASGTRFVRGDADGKGDIDISDPIFLLTYLFLGGEAPDCLDAGDVNDDGGLDITDAVYSLTFQFLGGDPPKSPFPECGIEQWIDGLSCTSFAGCR